ncbi:MAG TPA: hypothetical protein VJ859_15520, partial [Allosphingosinicella sp.]|nr:hypothetical protein [Allosphingosinicella sp.]
MITPARPRRFPRPRTTSVRAALLLGSALGSIAVWMPTRARADGFTGNPTVPTNIQVTNNQSTVTIDNSLGSTPSAIVTWTPTPTVPITDGNLDFLPSGNSADFVAGDGVTNFAILNRVFPDTTQNVSINGTVTSHIGGSTGGTVAFYTPNGLIVGAGASFNVGNLILTTANVSDSNWAASQTGTGANYVFDAANAGSFIRVTSGAQLNAFGTGGYLAMLSPRIEQAGIVKVNGSAAYVAAQQATLTINNGLFDIVVAEGGGTDDDAGAGGPDGNGPRNGIVHTGSTLWEYTDGVSAHRVYMVAVPKNKAITALLTGTVGFDEASSASFENGDIILSAGYDVHSRKADDSQVALAGGFIFGNPNAPHSSQSAQPVNGTPANFHILGGTYLGDLIGRASSQILAAAYSDGGVTPGNIDFQHDVTLIGRDYALISAEGEFGVHVGGDAIVTNGFGLNYHDWSTSGGTAALEAHSDSTLTIDGNATVDASVHAPTDSDANGGSARVLAESGTIAIGGDLTIKADAQAGDGQESAGAGQADGGNADLEAYAASYAGGGGSISVTGLLRMSADATGGDASDNFGGDGGRAWGGHVQVTVTGDLTIGSVDNTDGVSILSANATGGDGADQQDSEPGDGGSGGDGLPGTVKVKVYSGNLTSYRDLELHADGQGGDGADGGHGGDGGYAEEALVEIIGYDNFLDGGGEIDLEGLLLSAEGKGGDGGERSDDDAQFPGGSGGDGLGGTANVYAEFAHA